MIPGISDGEVLWAFQINLDVGAPNTRPKMHRRLRTFLTFRRPWLNLSLESSPHRARFNRALVLDATATRFASLPILAACNSLAVQDRRCLVVRVFQPTRDFAGVFTWFR